MSRSIIRNLSAIPYPCWRKWALIFLSASLGVWLTACGSTKVYTADKTIVYRDSVYNVSNVRIFTRKNSGTLLDKSVVDLMNVEKEGFEALLLQSPTIFVRQLYLLDEDEMVYQETLVSSWDEFKSMNKRFKSASKKLNKFLADSKKTQLKLK
jgi:hypothetical protein